MTKHEKSEKAGKARSGEPLEEGTVKKARIMTDLKKAFTGAIQATAMSFVANVQFIGIVLATSSSVKDNVKTEKGITTMGKGTVTLLITDGDDGRPAFSHKPDPKFDAINVPIKDNGKIIAVTCHPYEPPKKEKKSNNNNSNKASNKKEKVDNNVSTNIADEIRKAAGLAGDSNGNTGENGTSKAGGTSAMDGTVEKVDVNDKKKEYAPPEPITIERGHIITIEITRWGVTLAGMNSFLPPKGSMVMVPGFYYGMYRRFLNENKSMPVIRPQCNILEILSNKPELIKSITNIDVMRGNTKLIKVVPRYIAEKTGLEGNMIVVINTERDMEGNNALITSRQETDSDQKVQTIMVFDNAAVAIMKNDKDDQEPVIGSIRLSTKDRGVISGFLGITDLNKWKVMAPYVSFFKTLYLAVNISPKSSQMLGNAAMDDVFDEDEDAANDDESNKEEHFNITEKIQPASLGWINLANPNKMELLDFTFPVDKETFLSDDGPQDGHPHHTQFDCFPAYLNLGGGDADEVSPNDLEYDKDLCAINMFNNQKRGEIQNCSEMNGSMESISSKAYTFRLLLAFDNVNPEAIKTGKLSKLTIEESAQILTNTHKSLAEYLTKKLPLPSSNSSGFAEPKVPVCLYAFRQHKKK